MLDDWLTDWIRLLSGVPCCQIFGRGRRESGWRVIDLYATPRRSAASRWPLWRNACITWTARAIAVGDDFARRFLREQADEPASCRYPVSPAGGRLHDLVRRVDAGAGPYPSATEVIAHECGHTWQALRLGPFYLPLVGAVTLFREGPQPWNHFENEASEEGQFGGVVPGSVAPAFMASLSPLPAASDRQS